MTDRKKDNNTKSTLSRMSGLVLSLREHPFLRPELEPHRIRSIFKRLELFLGLLLIVLLIALLAILPPLTRANVATFYPDNCLGGWENSQNASREPSLSLDEALASDFTKDNSAYLGGTAQIYCGSFKGEIPQKTIPKKLTIRLAWSVDDGSILHKDPTPVVVPVDASTVPANPFEPIVDVIDNALQVPPVYPDSVIPPAEVEPMPTSAVDTVPTESIVAPDAPAPADQPALQSILYRLFGTKAYAEDTPASVPDVDAPAVDTPAQDTSADQVPADVVPVSTTPADISPLLEATPVLTNFALPDNTGGFMEVLYTINGTDWNSLGMVSRTDWHNASFDIPVSEWVNLSKLQVSLRPVANIDPYPVVYLDSMILEVAYEEDKVDDKKDPYLVTDIADHGSELTLEVKGGIENPLQLVIQTTNPMLGNLAIFNTQTKQNVLNTWTDQSDYVADPGYLGVGQYMVVTTHDPDSCSTRTFDQCLIAVDAITSASFSIIKNEKYEDINEPAQIDSAAGAAASVPSTETTPQS